MAARVSAERAHNQQPERGAVQDVTESATPADVPVGAPEAPLAVPNSSPNPARTSTASTQPTPAPVTAGTEQDAIARVSPSVVKVEADDGVGTGVVVGSDGLIITNAHVVGQSSRVHVALKDGQRLQAAVLASDASRDLATLQLEGARPPAVALADIDLLRPGQPLVAIGYALDLSGAPTITRGVFSTVRTGPSVDYVQTDAPINHGNSGGPLISLKGEMVGVNTLGLERSGGSQVVGINFAISSASIRQFLASDAGVARKTDTVTAPAVSPQSPAVTRRVWVAHSDGQGVYLRRSPNLEDRLNAWPDGTALDVLGDAVQADGFDWLPVRAPDGQNGYVPTTYMDSAPPVPTHAQPPATAPASPPHVQTVPPPAPAPATASATAITQAAVSEANRVWASVLVQNGAPLTDLERVYAGQWLQEVRSGVQAMRARGQYRVVRPTAQIIVRSAQYLPDGRIEADVAEQWDDRTYNADKSLATVQPGHVEQHYVLQSFGGQWKVVQSRIVRS
jgi:S1-C subfamily serine protease